MLIIEAGKREIGVELGLLMRCKWTIGRKVKKRDRLKNVKQNKALYVE